MILLQIGRFPWITEAGTLNIAPRSWAIIEAMKPYVEITELLSVENQAGFSTECEIRAFATQYSSHCLDSALWNQACNYENV